MNKVTTTATTGRRVKDETIYKGDKRWTLISRI